MAFVALVVCVIFLGGLAVGAIRKVRALKATSLVVLVGSLILYASVAAVLWGSLTNG